MMKFPLSRFLLPAFALLTQAVDAQVIVDENTEFKNAFFASQIQFLRGPSADLVPQLAGFNLLEKSGYGPGYIYDFCANFDQGDGVNWTFDSVTAGMGGLGRQSEIGALFSNAIPEFNGYLADYISDNNGDWSYPDDPDLVDEYDNLQGYAAGMQIALWELIHEDASFLTIDNTDGNSGNFRIDLAAAPNARADLADSYAEQILAQIRSGNWSDEGGYTVHFADAPDGEQDRLWVTVPEPSSALLGAFGMLALLRRRRA